MMNASPGARGRLAPALVLAAAAALFLVHAGRFAGYAQDDAFISFTYARHLIDDGALAYRLDERAIGYSNLLWVLLAAPVYALAGATRLLGAMQLLAVLCGAFAVVATASLARRLGAGRVAAVGAALVLASVSAFAMQAQSGLETTLYTALLLLGAIGVAGATDRNGASGGDARTRERHLLVGVVGFALAALARPEGLGYLLLAVAIVLLARRHERFERAPLRALAAGGAIVGAAALLLLAMHGTVVPNTVVVKLSASYPVSVRLAAGVDYAVEAARAIPVGWLLPLAVATVVAGRRSPAMALVAGLALGPWVESALVGGDAMPGYRFVVPGLPFLVALAMAAGPALRLRLSRASAAWTMAGLAALFGLGAQWLLPRSALAAAEVAHAARAGRLVDGYVEVARGLAPICTARSGGGSSPELATDVAGAFGFFTDCRVLDTWGLASAEVATRGRAFPGQPFVTFGVVAPEVVLERRPAILLPYPPLPMPAPWGRERAIAALFPAGFYAGRPELADYRSAVLQTGGGRYAYLVRSDWAAGTAPRPPEAPAAPGAGP